MFNKTSITLLVIILALGYTDHKAAAGAFGSDGWGVNTPFWMSTNPGTSGSGFTTQDTLTVNLVNPAANAGSGRTRLYQSLGLNTIGAWDGHTSYWGLGFVFQEPLW